MEMLVTKFSNGKYRNEGELFAEPISEKNVKLMGEMIALQTLRTLKKYDWKIADFSLLCYALFFVQISSSEDKNLQENKTKTVQGTASSTAGIFSLPEYEQTAVCTALLKRGGAK